MTGLGVGYGGGKAPQRKAHHLRRERGPGARLDLPTFVRIGVIVEPHAVNGPPGASFRDRDNKVLDTWTLDAVSSRFPCGASAVCDLDLT